MGISVQLQEEGDWSVPINPRTPRDVLTSIDVRTYAYSTIIVTPHHLGLQDVSASDLLDLAIYTGVYLKQSDGRLNLEGSGLVRWLGGENDGGDLRVGTDTTSGDIDLEAQLDARVFTRSNGLTKGTVNSDATTRTIKIEGGTTARQFLDTICALYPNGPWEWRVNTDGTIDVNTRANLYATTASPTVVLTQEGGRDGNITGIRADLDLSSVDVTDYRTDVEVDWNDGTNDGAATNTEPATWAAFDGTDPVLRTMLDWKPRASFNPHPNKWSDRVAAAHYATWVVNSQTQANTVATRHANQVGSYATTLQASIDEYNPLRFLNTGDTVYVYDLDLGLTDTTNEVYYRGTAIHPTTLRVQAIDTPILEGYGVYLRTWDGAAFDLVDLTPYVDFEEGDTTVELGTRNRFHRPNARPRRFNKKKVKRQARRMYMVQQYLQRVG